MAVSRLRLLRQHLRRKLKKTSAAKHVVRNAVIVRNEVNAPSEAVVMAVAVDVVNALKVAAASAAKAAKNRAASAAARADPSAPAQKHVLKAARAVEAASAAQKFAQTASPALKAVVNAPVGTEMIAPSGPNAVSEVARRAMLHRKNSRWQTRLPWPPLHEALQARPKPAAKSASPGSRVRDVKVAKGAKGAVKAVANAVAVATNVGTKHQAPKAARRLLHPKARTSLPLCRPMRWSQQPASRKAGTQRSASRSRTTQPHLPRQTKTSRAAIKWVVRTQVRNVRRVSAAAATATAVTAANVATALTALSRPPWTWTVHPAMA